MIKELLKNRVCYPGERGGVSGGARESGNQVMTPEDRQRDDIQKQSGGLAVLSSVTKGKEQRKSTEVRRWMNSLGVSNFLMKCEEGHPQRMKGKRRGDCRLNKRLEESRQVK